VKDLKPTFIAACLGLIFAGLLSWTFGWVATLMLAMPGFMFATMIEGHDVAKFAPYIFIGNSAFYTVLFCGIVWVHRRFYVRNR
jgi:hypothetical protein